MMCWLLLGVWLVGREWFRGLERWGHEGGLELVGHDLSKNVSVIAYID